MGGEIEKVGEGGAKKNKQTTKMQQCVLKKTPSLIQSHITCSSRRFAVGPASTPGKPPSGGHFPKFPTGCSPTFI